MHGVLGGGVHGSGVLDRVGAKEGVEWDHVEVVGLVGDQFWKKNKVVHWSVPELGRLGSREEGITGSGRG